MRILDRYIAKTVLLHIALVTLLLFSLQIFILFVSELRSIGQGDFTVWQALIFVMMKVPEQVYLFFPIASLLGCLLGLGLMAGHSELIVMGASGFSIRQIVWAILKAAFFIILIVTVLGETVVPKLTSMADERKISKMSGGNALRTASGVWIRDTKSFIHVDLATSPDNLQGVLQYVFNENQELTIIRTAERANYKKEGVGEEGRWFLQGVKESHISEQGITTQQHKEQWWDTEMTPRLLSVATIQSHEMTLRELKAFIEEQKKHHMDVSRYELTFWKRIIQPFTSCVMMMLAVPFVFGPLRSTTVGLRLLIGAIAGFGFYLLNQFFSPFSIAYQVPPLIGALGPTLFFVGVALLMLRRVR